MDDKERKQWSHGSAMLDGMYKRRREGGVIQEFRQIQQMRVSGSDRYPS